MDHDATSGRPPFKVTGATLDVLEALLHGSGEVHGFRVAQLTGRPTGSVYPILMRLENAGWVDSRWESVHELENRPRRRFYVLTEDGRSKARALLLARRPALDGTPPGELRIRAKIRSLWTRLRPAAALV